MELPGYETENWAPRMRLYFVTLTEHFYDCLYQFDGSSPYQSCGIEVLGNNKPFGLSFDYHVRKEWVGSVWWTIKWKRNGKRLGWKCCIKQTVGLLKKKLSASFHIRHCMEMSRADVSSSPWSLELRGLTQCRRLCLLICLCALWLGQREVQDEFLKTFWTTEPTWGRRHVLQW